ncbi:VOC family protein [Nocardia sp. NPDC051570]|uniref:VOC family protein n=1 Tax=Nocardia sp. NPDC051570 TaxID=3364324 RepID=UPI0037B92B61
MASIYPTLRSIVLDTTDTRRTAEFYRRLLGWEYLPEDARDTAGLPEWLALAPPNGGPRLSFQLVPELPRSTWPKHDVPQQLHPDFAVADRGELIAQHDRVSALGAPLLLDRTDHPDEPLYVSADPAGHPFCVVAVRDVPAGRPAPTLRSIVLDSTDPGGLAEFYRQLTGYDYAPHDTPPTSGEPDYPDWLNLLGPTGIRLAFQPVPELPRTTWPEPEVPQQLHLDFQVPTTDHLRAQHRRILELGATLLHDEFDDPVEPLYVYADPAGHPFCVFVLPPGR